MDFTSDNNGILTQGIRRQDPNFKKWPPNCKVVNLIKKLGCTWSKNGFTRSKKNKINQ
jgi:hypothetical protein